MEAAVLRTYHDEITRCAAQIELGTVQLAQSADALLRQSLWLVLLLCLRLEELASTDEVGLTKVVDEFVQGVCASRLPRLAEQVRELLEPGPAPGA